MSWSTYWRLVVIVGTVLVAASCYLGGRDVGRAEARFDVCWQLRFDCGEDAYVKVCK